VTKATAQKTASKKSVVQPSTPASEKAAVTQETPSAKTKATDKVPAAKKAAAASASTPVAAKKAAKAASPAPGSTPEPASTKTTTAPKTTEKASGASAKPSQATAKQSSRSAASPAPVSPAPPATSRFADRFAPPRPPTRQMSNLSNDLPRPAHITDPKLVNAWRTKAGRDMSDEEIMAMPDSEYMNEKQLDFFRGRLQEQKDALLSNAGETTEHLREDTSIVPDPADRATIEEEHALELRTRDRERKLLKKISQSLMRIENGEYGFCDETGEPIGLGRLIARPTATLSLEAQQRRELKQKMFGD
jgi:DnaK suppressor protein